LGIRSFVKTSGATGLHIFVPLRASYSYEQSRIFAEAIARVVVMENRRTATIERNPQKRSGKVYVDFLQNRRGQTIVPPYCVRPVPGAQVSMPLNWDELRTDLSPNHFTLRNAGNRIRETGDLFRPVLEMEQDLLPAVASLEDYMRGDRPG
jgi:bifunctional non-homologous end joining protein LigD